MLSVNEIRQMYLDFFEKRRHHIVPSAPMVIKDDPTLMFTNAGMNQFKDIILGNAPIKYPRIADSQKCLRVSGKHNDLEEVGHDTYHHTMFEMLGNWSFGDYFKEEIIGWAWELLTDVYGLPKERLYVTVFGGAPEEGLERDDEASTYWSRFISADRIIDGNKHDNFWEMGDQGPCGPCSEIHIDLRSVEEREKVDGKTLVNQDHPLVIEIWNLVFMQYNRLADGSLSTLPNKVIDTGMGLERLCMALQSKKSNYDTDVFTPLINKIAEITKHPYGVSEEVNVAERVIADHIRTIAFSIADGQLPSNAKAGYVIRRILRRAVRYGYTFLSQKEPFMYLLVPTLIKSMGDAYPEIKAQEQIISKVIQEEEASFLRTLETGIHLLNQHIEAMKANNNKKLDGTLVFELYDTYGFPTDLTELILKEYDLEADLEGFKNEMEAQKNRARSAAQVETSDWVIVHDGAHKFVGYEHLSASEVRIVRYRKVQNNKGEIQYQIVFSESPFYAEMGGQVGDKGYIEGIIDGQKIDVIDTIRENNLPISILEELPHQVSQPFELVVDSERRRAIMANHSATHLMHKALREVLGTHVEQKGSLVSEYVLRFDFSHYAKMTKEEIRQVESLVTKAIISNYPLDEFRNVPIEEAKKMGAMALFGEKYGDEVRVIQFGDSIELCGGTHVPNTGVIGSFRIISESSIASGIRRIEAVTGATAEKYLYNIQDQFAELQEKLQTPNPSIAIERLILENEALKKEIKNYEGMKKNALIEQLINTPKVIKEGTTLYHLQENLSATMVKDIAFGIKAKTTAEDYVFVAGTTENGKALLTLMLSDSMVKKGFNAGTIVREAAKLIQGGGGGQPTFATAGGKQPEHIQEALNRVLELLELNNE